MSDCESIRDELRKSFEFYHCKKNESDSRGRHDKKYREERRKRMEEECSYIRRECSKCDGIDCFLDNGTCTNCGYVDGNGSYIQMEFDIHTARLHTRNVYIPKFYTREKYNNFRMVCPNIDSDILQDILFEIWNSTTGGRRRKIHSTEITRDVIYKSINRLYAGCEKRYLNLRERWLTIKSIMISNFDVFWIEDTTRFNCWYYSIRPTEELINRLVQQSDLIDMTDDDESDGRNRPNRDVIAIYLLLGFHPVLCLMYLWYWNIPRTYRYRKNNFLRLERLFKISSKRHKFMKWPPIPLPSIEEIESLEDFPLEDEMDYNTSLLFPEEFLEKHIGTNVSKYSIMYM